MSDDTQVRDFLEQMADEVGPSPVDPRPVTRRARRYRAASTAAVVVGVVAILAGGVAGMDRLTATRLPAVGPDLPGYHHNGEIVVQQAGGVFAIDPVSGAGHKLLECPPQTDGHACNVDYHLAWSPDGTRLAYGLTRIVSAGNPRSGTPANSQLGVFVWDPATGETQKISTCQPVHCGNVTYYLDWSPDGARIAVAVGARIDLMDPDGGNVSSLFNADDRITGLSWSPDGARIAFSTGGDLYAIGADGSSFSHFVDGSGVGVSDPAWSPDGSKIGYISLIESPESVNGSTGWFTGQIWVVDQDGSNPTKLFEEGPCCFRGPHGGPAWAPDGSRIVFTLGDPTYHLWVMNADGSDPVRLSQGSADTPAWRPIP
jgi:Tol biopolymer transport system component